jgi:hypothetical protein
VREWPIESADEVCLIEASYVPPNCRIASVEDPFNADFSEAVPVPDETTSVAAA